MINVGDIVLTPTMGEGTVLATSGDLAWVAITMVDGVKRPSTYSFEQLERRTFLKEEHQ